MTDALATTGADLRFAIGDQAWWASWESPEDRITCPDCGGTGRIRVIFHDETEVSIECANCRRGYDPPLGHLVVYTRKAMAKFVVITGVEIRGGSVEWGTSDSYRVPDDRLFDNEADALTKAQSIAAEADQAERDRILKKEKDTRSWAWNASYHRGEIKEAERRIAYHKSKLEVASLKARDDRKAKREAGNG